MTRYLRSKLSLWVKQHLGHMRCPFDGKRPNRVELGFIMTSFFLERVLTPSSSNACVLYLVAIGMFFFLWASILDFALKGRVKSGDRVGPISLQNNAFQEMIQEHLQAAKLIKSSAMRRQSFAEFEKFAREISAWRREELFMPKALRPFPTVGRGSYSGFIFCCARARDVFCTDLGHARHFLSYLPKKTNLQQMWQRVP